MNQVTNAANEKQIKRAENSEVNRRNSELKDLREVLGTKAGRNVLWRIIKKCKTFESVWENSARIHYNTGQQDLGHFVMAEIVKANEESLFEMMRESQKGEF